MIIAVHYKRSQLTLEKQASRVVRIQPSFVQDDCKSHVQLYMRTGIMVPVILEPVQ